MHDKHLAQRLIHGEISVNPVSLSFSSALSALTHFQSSASLSLPRLASTPWHPFLLIPLAWRILQQPLPVTEALSCFLSSASRPRLDAPSSTATPLSPVADACGLSHRACMFFSVGSNDSWHEEGRRYSLWTRGHQLVTLDKSQGWGGQTLKIIESLMLLTVTFCGRDANGLVLVTSMRKSEMVTLMVICSTGERGTSAGMWSGFQGEWTGDGERTQMIDFLLF